MDIFVWYLSLFYLTHLKFEESVSEQDVFSSSQIWLQHDISIICIEQNEPTLHHFEVQIDKQHWPTAQYTEHLELDKDSNCFGLCVKLHIIHVCLIKIKINDAHVPTTSCTQSGEFSVNLIHIFI